MRQRRAGCEEAQIYTRGSSYQECHDEMHACQCMAMMAIKRGRQTAPLVNK